tara:strand:- start:107 stop:541 length:435 start_codon:yes stop_codon:yes gene_type:complete
MNNKGKTMNLETYLETNNFDKKDLTNLFSVGCVLNTKTGDTFPIMADGTFDFEDGMNVVTDEFDAHWWENLGKWKADERLVLDTINNLNTEPYDHSIDTIDPDEPTDLPGGEESYLDSLLTTGFDNEPTETEWLEQKAELALGV